MPERNLDGPVKILMIDNYDSFTFNLVQYLQVLGADVLVRRNDVLTVDEAVALQPTHLVISPGPGDPDDAGISKALIERVLGRIPILGVCLGHQSLCEVLGGRVVPARALMHGKSSMVDHDGRGIFAGLPQPLQVGRYHSLAVRDLPDVLEVSARTADGEIMAVRHRQHVAVGVQFHPESILTPQGMDLLRNFLRLAPQTGEPR
ncbi:MAG: aminodeoxychorismate/anthranilate synthase component II [Alphaproteobacteria bacterium]|nr:aminodeoxychorismate/anthranilate synthase component II [Alphaproteobacteria bacterium]